MARRWLQGCIINCTSFTSRPRQLLPTAWIFWPCLCSKRLRLIGYAASINWPGDCPDPIHLATAEKVPSLELLTVCTKLKEFCSEIVIAGVFLQVQPEVRLRLAQTFELVCFLLCCLVSVYVADWRVEVPIWWHWSCRTYIWHPMWRACRLWLDACPVMEGWRFSWRLGLWVLRQNCLRPARDPDLRFRSSQQRTRHLPLLIRIRATNWSLEGAIICFWDVGNVRFITFAMDSLQNRHTRRFVIWTD